MTHEKLTTLLSLLVSLFASFLSSAQDIKAGGSVEIRINGVTLEEKGRIDGGYLVSDDGTVKMPHIGKVLVAGMKYADASAKITDGYRNAKVFANPQITLYPGTKGGDMMFDPITISGFVDHPGPNKYILGMTLLNAIKSAGGASELGNLKKVVVTRGATFRVFDMTDASGKNLVLNPGDKIEVLRLSPMVPAP